MLLKYNIRIYLIAFLFVSVCSAQDFSSQWEAHFSFFNVKDVAYGADKIYAASENAIFTFDLTTQQLDEITTINGLSAEEISTIYFSEDYNLLIVGHVNGLMEIVDIADGDILKVVDILEKDNIPPNNKRINHFNEYEDSIYISTDFGVSVYSLDRLEFGDTYFIGPSGTQKVVNQTAVFQGFIYAATINGVQKADVNDANLIDFNLWPSIIGGTNWLGIEAVGDNLYATRSNRVIYNVVNDVFNALITYSTIFTDIKSFADNLIVTTEEEIFVYDSSFNQINSASINADYDTNFTSGIISPDNSIFIGTTEFGVLSPSLPNDNGFAEIYPQGPLRNNVFSITAFSNQLYTTFGDYSQFYNPSPIIREGYSRLINDEWFNVPYDSVFDARNLNAIAPNPNNLDQVFISSFQDGILEVNDGSPTIFYDDTNSGLESLILPGNPDFNSIRVSDLKFDSNGLLWSITSLVDKVLKSYDPASGQWVGYSFSDLLEPFGTLGYGDLVIDNNGTKWIGSFSVGVIGFNENGNLIKNITDELGEGNLPEDTVTALAIDDRNQLWIGTEKGLRVFFGTSTFFQDEEINTSEIIILQDGVPEELLFQQFISDIEVDGGNNKWIGTLTSGIFLFSPNGQQTIYHFTQDNSPLPSNNINDISVDETNGKVFIATDKGLVTFLSGSSSPKDGLESAFVFPNPVRPNFDITDKKVKIQDISDNVNIKITDIEGNLVAEAESRTNSRFKGYNLEIDGGTAFWNGKNLANNIVKSGVYLVMLSDLDTFETKVLKVMVIR